MTGAPSTAPARTTASRHRRDDHLLERTTGVLAMLGGVAWVAAALTHAAQPTGCVGDGCLSSSMREASTTTTGLVAVAAVLMAASGLGLLQVVRRRGRLGRPGTIGAGLCTAGIVSLTLGVALQAADADDDFEWMPYFVGPGVVAIAVGAALVGWVVVRSSVVPRWAGAAVIVGAVLILLGNEQTAAVLLFVPFGLAWAATGAALLRSHSATGGISRNDVR